MQAADQVRVLLGKVSERAIGKRHHRCEVVIDGWIYSRIVADDRVESETIEVCDQCFKCRRCGPVPHCPVTTLAVSNGLGVVWSGVEPLGH